ncbi:MAG: restriction endonuclease [Galactobacter sp.]
MSKKEPRTWLVRGGKYGESDAWMLDNGVAAIDFNAVGSLVGAKSRDDVLQLVVAGNPEESPGSCRNWAAQLWAFAGRIEVGDLVVLPQKATRQLHIGRVTGDYTYVEDGPDYAHHRRAVEWIRTEIPRPVFEQDLLYSFGAFSTVCEVSRNDAAYRIRVVAAQEGAKDPGPRDDARSRDESKRNAARKPNKAAGVAASSGIRDDHGAQDDDDLQTDAPDLSTLISDRVTNRILTRFKGDKLEQLVAAVLEAMGMVITQAPKPGTDGGVDILAGHGLFGMDSPRLVVQVKSETTAVGDPVVNALHGAITREQADQGLLVALGGVNSNARQNLRGHRFTIAVWDEAKLLDAIYATYESLPAAIRADLPLQQRWVLIDDE